MSYEYTAYSYGAPVSGGRTPGAYYDGDFTIARAITPIWREYPFQRFGDNNTFIAKQTYKQFTVCYQPLPLDSLGPIQGTYFVEDSVPTLESGGICTFDRSWAVLPATHSDYESFPYTYVFFGVATKGSGNNAQEVFEVLNANGGTTVPTTSRLQYDYFHTSKTSDIPLLATFRIVDPSTYLGAIPNAKDAELVAEDSHLENWKGNFWARITRYVPNRAAGTLANSKNG